jgi:prepilin-type processing-associated H-X9-DG protein
VLVAILIPAVLTARQHVLTAKCLAHLHQIGIAIDAYAIDNDNSLVPGDYYGLADGWPLPGAGSWEDILADGNYFPAPIGKSTFKGSREVNFNDLTFDNDNLLRCPSGLDEDVADYGLPVKQVDALGMFFSLRSSDITGTGVRSWYACNMSPYQEFYGGRPLPFKFLPDINPQNWSYDYTINRLSKFHNSSSLPLIFDGCWMFWDNAPNINARHGGNTQTNILFADWHCETQATSTLPNDNWYVN